MGETFQGKIEIYEEVDSTPTEHNPEDLELVDELDHTIDRTVSNHIYERVAIPKIILDTADKEKGTIVKLLGKNLRNSILLDGSSRSIKLYDTSSSSSSVIKIEVDKTEGARLILGGGRGTNMLPGFIALLNKKGERTLTLDGEKGDCFLSNADCAEDFDIADKEEVEPGTVMVIQQEGKLEQSNTAYDKRVAGVISGAGSLKPGIVLDKKQSQNNRKSISLMGKVYCKVDAKSSPIEVGDLLTTSSSPGYAMKATDPLKAFGAVIGKALHPHSTGKGLIPILISLQ